MNVSTASFQIIADLLRARTGQHLGPERMWRINGALSGVFRRHSVSNIDQLVCLLAEAGSEPLAQEVVEALLNNETYFFRDRQSFDALAEQVLPQLWNRLQYKRRLRIWSAGCSSGQELYSLAMILQTQRERWRDWQIELLGTDVSHRIVAAARKGCFSQFEVQRGLTVAQMLAYFRQQDTSWIPQDDLRSKVRFRQHNLLDPAPSEGPFDMILCRNVLLYFEQDVRRHVFRRLHETLDPGGLLMLGAGETVVGQTPLFTPLGDGSGLFQRENSATDPVRISA